MPPPLGVPALITFVILLRIIGRFSLMFTLVAGLGVKESDFDPLCAHGLSVLLVSIHFPNTESNSTLTSSEQEGLN